MQLLRTADATTLQFLHLLENYSYCCAILSHIVSFLYHRPLMQRRQINNMEPISTLRSFLPFQFMLIATLLHDQWQLFTVETFANQPAKLHRRSGSNYVHTHTHTGHMQRTESYTHTCSLTNFSIRLHAHVHIQLGTHQLPGPALYIKSSYWILVNANHFLPLQFILLMCMWPLLPASVSRSRPCITPTDIQTKTERLVFLKPLSHCCISASSDAFVVSFATLHSISYSMSR